MPARSYRFAQQIAREVPFAGHPTVGTAWVLAAHGMAPTGAPILPGSTGNKFLFVPLRDKAAVDQAVLDVRALLEAMGNVPHLGIFVFAPDPDPAAGRVYSRMFAPHTSGIPEDPATGSASGPLGAYLVLNGLVRKGAQVPTIREHMRHSHPALSLSEGEGSRFDPLAPRGREGRSSSRDARFER